MLTGRDKKGHFLVYITCHPVGNNLGNELQGHTPDFPAGLFCCNSIL
jgi:hypothetical protein